MSEDAAGKVVMTGLPEYAAISFDDEGIYITHRYPWWIRWLARKNQNFSIRIDSITAIYVDRIGYDPYNAILSFIDINDVRYSVVRRMKNWDDLLPFLVDHFPGFDLEAIEESFFQFETVLLCWEKKS